jgi:hypothetical protein
MQMRDYSTLTVFTTFTNQIYEKGGNAFRICITIHNQSEWEKKNNDRLESNQLPIFQYIRQKISRLKDSSCVLSVINRFDDTYNIYNQTLDSTKTRV